MTLLLRRCLILLHLLFVLNYLFRFLHDVDLLVLLEMAAGNDSLCTHKSILFLGNEGSNLLLSLRNTKLFQILFVLDESNLLEERKILGRWVLVLLIIILVIV